jgi:hypothetical protein
LLSPEVADWVVAALAIGHSEMEWCEPDVDLGEDLKKSRGLTF